MTVTEVKKMFRNSTYPFLGAAENEWIGGYGDVTKIKDMDKDHREHSYRYLKEHKSDIYGAFFLSEFNIDENQYQETRKIAETLYENKLRELEKYLY